MLQRTQPASGQSPQCPDAYLQNGLALVLAGAVEEREGGSQGAITPLPSLWAQPGTQPCWLSSHPGGGGRPGPSAPCSPWRLGWQQGRHVAELAAELQPSIPAQLPALPLIDFAVRSRQAAARCPAPHLLTLSPPGRGDGKGGGGGRALQGGCAALQPGNSWVTRGGYGSCGPSPALHSSPQRGAAQQNHSTHLCFSRHSETCSS